MTSISPEAGGRRLGRHLGLGALRRWIPGRDRATVTGPSPTSTRRHLRAVPTTGDATAESSRVPIAVTDGMGQLGLGAAYLVLVVLLCLIGSVMILSASSVAAIEEGGSSFSVFFRQCAWLVVGLVAMTVAARTDYRRLTRAVPVLVIAAVGLLVLVLVPGIGVEVNGAQRWLGAGNFRLQPAEPAKFALICFVAALVARERHRVAEWRVVLRPVVVVLGLVSVLVMLQPNLGTTIVVAATVGLMLLRAGVPIRFLAIVGGLGAIAGAYLAMAESYRRARVLAFLDPWADPEGTGYQTVQSLIGVANGGATGTGLGASRAKWGFLPEAHTDFVFAVIGEELGLAGSLIVVGLFAAMVVLGLRIAARAADTFGTMLAVGVSAWFSVQAFVNVGAVLGILPITGVPLPFVSFGGSSLVMTMIAAGVLVNIAIQGRVPTSEVRERIAARRAANAANSSRRPNP